MKKFLAILLAFVLMLSFTACGADTKDEEKDDDVKIEETTEKEEETTADANSGATADVNAGATADTGKTDDTTDAKEEAKPFALGKVENGVYSNEFTGWSITLDSNWTYSTEEEIKQLNQVVGDLVGEEYVAAVKNNAAIYDMMAVHSNGTDNVNVVLSNAGRTYTLDELKGELENTFTESKAAFESIGYTNIGHSIDTVDVEGREIAILAIVAEFNGMQMKQITYVESIGMYALSCSITALDENNLNAVLDSISFAD